MKEKNLKVSLSELRENGIQLQLAPGKYKLWEVVEAIIEAERGKKWEQRRNVSCVIRRGIK